MMNDDDEEEEKDVVDVFSGTNETCSCLGHFMSTSKEWSLLHCTERNSALWSEFLLCRDKFCIAERNSVLWREIMHCGERLCRNSMLSQYYQTG